MISRRAFLIASAALSASSLLPSIAFADDPVPTGRLDLRNASSDITYQLIVLARDKNDSIEWPGHAYFLVGEEDSKAQVCRFDKSKGFGFYPKTGTNLAETILSIASPVPGEIKTDPDLDFSEKLTNRRLIITISQNGYDAARAAAKKYEKDKPYSLGDTDCVGFVSEVLAGLRDASKGSTDTLTLPGKEFCESPKSYLTQLLKANGGWPK